MAGLCATTAEDVVRAPSSAAEHEVAALIEEPVSMWTAHPHWPSAMAVYGPPIELSMRLDWAATPSIRIVTDVTDHRQTMRGNRPRYVSSAASVIGGSDAAGSAERLCAEHLVDHPTFRSRMLHGLGYTASGSRGTVYFRQHYDLAAGARAAPDHLQPVLGALGAWVSRTELVGYDFVAGRLHRPKAFATLSDQALELLVRRREPGDRDFGAAAALVRRGRPASGSGHHDALQVAQEEHRLVPKLYLACGRWGWHTPRGFSELLATVAGELGVDVAPLGTFLDHSVERELSLVPTSVAIGGTATQPNVTFYLAPADRDRSAGTSSAQPRPTVSRSVRSAVSFVGRAHAGEGLWPTDDLDPVEATARLAALLLDCPAARPLVGAMANGFRAALDDDRGRALLRVGFVADAVRVLQALGQPVPDRLLDAIGSQVGELCRAGVASIEELSSLALALMAEPDRDPDVRSVLTLLLNRWETTEDASLASCAAVSRVLTALVESAGPHAADERASASLLEIGHRLRASPVPADDPDSMCHWLAAWLRTGGNPGFLSAQRVTTALLDSQSAEGGWNGGDLTSTCLAVAALGLVS